MTLPTKSDKAAASEPATRADAIAKKEERAREGAEAMTEYLANARMVRERTERLRALRLAKEAADKTAADRAAATKPQAAKAAAGKRAGAKA
jgi:hypothetical protein